MGKNGGAFMFTALSISGFLAFLKSAIFVVRLYIWK